MPDLLDLSNLSETAPETVTPQSTVIRVLFDVFVGKQTSDLLTEASWRERRHQVVRAGRALKRDHRAWYSDLLAARAAANRRRSVLDLLRELSERHGVSWSDTAKMLGISVPALRKWRKIASGTTPENHHRLAGLVAFYSVLGEQGVASPARWMAMPLVPGYNVNASDVYGIDAAPALLDLAAGNGGVDAEGLLDEVEPGWRETWKSQYEVFEAEDGQLSMRPRTTV